MFRTALTVLTALAFVGLTACGCLGEPDPNLREIPAQKNRGRGCGPAIGVSPTVPYKIEGGHGWR